MFKKFIKIASVVIISVFTVSLLVNAQVGGGVSTPVPFRRSGNDWIRTIADYQWGSTTTPWKYGFYNGLKVDEINSTTLNVTGPVGIGTTTPTYQLEVVGTSTAGFFGVSQNSAGDLFAIDNSGNVGIGTSTPEEMLHIAGAGTTRFIVEDTANEVTLRLVAASTGAHFGSLTDDPVLFNVNNTSVARLTASGLKVGLGVSDPAGTLELTAGQPDLIFTDGANADTWRQVFVAADNSLRFQYTGNEFNFLSNGNLGINTTGPDRKLDILDATNPQLRLTHTDGSVYVDMQGTSAGHLSISGSGGNIGIGTTTPDHLLHLYSASATSTLYISSGGAGLGGEIIMEDATGGTCTRIKTQAGAIESEVVTCPTN